MKRKSLNTDRHKTSISTQISMEKEQANYLYTEALNSLFVKEKLHVRHKVATLIEENEFDTVAKLIPLIGQKSLDFIVYYPTAPLPKPGYNYLFEAILAFFNNPAEQQLLFEFINSILKHDPAQSQFVVNQEPHKGRTALHGALLSMTPRRSDFDVPMIRSLIAIAPALINIPTRNKRALPLELAVRNFRSDLFEILLPHTHDLNYRNGAGKTILTLISETAKEVAQRGYPPIETQAITEISTLFHTEWALRERLRSPLPFSSVATSGAETKSLAPSRQILKARRTPAKKMPATFSLDMSDSYQRRIAITLAEEQVKIKQEKLLENACRALSALRLSEPDTDEKAGKKKQLPALARLTVFAANVVEQKHLENFTYTNSTRIPNAESLPTSCTASTVVVETMAKKQYSIYAQKMGKKKQLPAIARLTVFAANVAEQQRLDSIRYQRPTSTPGTVTPFYNRK
jgi:hypothetical protein